MLPSEKIKAYMKNKEKLRLKAYKPLPTDRLTIGYGSTFINGRPVNETDIVTKEIAEEMFSKEVDSIAKQISATRIPANVTGNQFDAVVSLVYNIGFSAFKQSPTGKLFYAGLSISDKFPLWNKSDGITIPGLVIRRIEEREIYDHNRYPA